MNEKGIKDHPKPKESWMQFFRRKRQFADLILLAWSTIEFNIDQLVARQFGLFYTDQKAKILLEMLFYKKLNFLKENKVITETEFKTLRKFQEYRNKLFHGKQPHYFILSEAEKDKIMDNAIKATHITRDALTNRRK